MRMTLFALAVCGAVIAMAPSQGLQAASAPDGAAIFRMRCQSCHSVEVGKPVGVGPNLSGVVGRKAASTGYSYSTAMKGSGLIWTKANLDNFLAAPAKTVPGTRMVISVKDNAERAALITYLEKKR